MAVLFEYLTTVTVPKLSGQRKISDLGRLSRLELDPYFKKLNDLKRAGADTPESRLDVLGITGSGTLREIYAALPGDVENSWLTEDQVLKFCEDFPHFLSSYDYNFFPLKGDYLQRATMVNMFMAMVLIVTGRVEVKVLPFTDEQTWYSPRARCRLIVAGIPDSKSYQAKNSRVLETAAG